MMDSYYGSYRHSEAMPATCKSEDFNSVELLRKQSKGEFLTPKEKKVCKKEAEQNRLKKLRAKR